MEKTIEISGQSVKFKTNGIALLQYKSQTGRNLIPDILKLLNAQKTDNVQGKNVSAIDIEKLDLDVLNDICWTFAKIADPSIPNTIEWMQSFEAFPIMDVFKEIIPLVMECISCSAEVKNALATAGFQNQAKNCKQKKSFLWQRK